MKIYYKPEQVPANTFANVADGQDETQFPPERKYPETQAEQDLVSVQDVQVLGQAKRQIKSAAVNRIFFFCRGGLPDLDNCLQIDKMLMGRIEHSHLGIEATPSYKQCMLQ